MSKLLKIIYFERGEIELYLRMGKSHRWIGKKLVRGHTDISREIKRNSTPYFPYCAKDAQHMHDSRQRKKNKKKLEKFEYKKVKEFVVENIKEDLSPEQIAGILKEQPDPAMGGLTISHESIYKYIYDGPGRFELLYSHLRTKRHKRRKKFSRKNRNKIKIKERVSIHSRPDEIDKKERVGDWETDSVIFSKQKEILAHTQYMVLR